MLTVSWNIIQPNNRMKRKVGHPHEEKYVNTSSNLAGDQLNLWRRCVAFTCFVLYRETWCLFKKYIRATAYMKQILAFHGFGFVVFGPYAGKLRHLITSLKLCLSTSDKSRLHASQMWPDVGPTFLPVPQLFRLRFLLSILWRHLRFISFYRDNLKNYLLMVNRLI